ncbi:cysteine synthase A [Clostridium sediminicola]|uniref:cysteine synthase A n=1 Tax=Clostridium sediminicola TaxID=3114879 RepID=UPI0031F1F2E9
MMLENIIDTIGNTPLLSLKKYFNGSIFAKCEFLNPGGSIKDRIAKFMIEEAEKEGKLKPGMTIVEPTSGNTGIGISLVGVRKGYKVVIVMPENMSEERKKVIKAFGAELVLTPKEESIEGTLKEVEKLKSQNKNIFVLNQFKNPNNPLIHYKTTAVEMCNQLNEKVDIFVSGLGSGGTLAGIGKYLKEKHPSCVVAAVEPKNVSALLGHEPGLHKIQGIGDGFIPDILDTKIIDEIIEVTDDDAIAYARKLARVCGCLVGVSSGANIWAAIKMAEKYGKDKNIVTVLPDRAERYFSTSLL